MMETELNKRTGPKAVPSKPRPIAKSRTQNSSDVKQVILDAALKSFARDGFDGASLPRISEAANVGHPLIHYHFGSKDALWRAAATYAFKDIIAQAQVIESASRGLSPLDRLKVLIRAFSHFAAQNPDHFALFMSEVRTNSDRYRWLCDTYTDVFFEHLQNILREAQEAGMIKTLPLDNLSLILMGSILVYFATNRSFPKGTDMAKLADEHADLVLDLLLNGAAPR